MQWRPRQGTTSIGDPELQEILSLRSKDKAQILRVLNNDEAAGLAVPHVIPLLAWDPWRTRLFTLRKCRRASRRAGQRMVDPRNLRPTPAGGCFRSACRSVRPTA